MIPFSDYQLLREVSERFPGSVEIVRGEVFFNEDFDITEGLWDRMKGWFGGKQQPQQPQMPPGMPSNPLQSSQVQTPQLYTPKPGQIDTTNNPGFKADVAALRQVYGALQTPRLKQIMSQWMGKIFQKIPSMTQQTAGANMPVPPGMDAGQLQGQEMGGSMNRPVMTQTDTGVQPQKPGIDKSGQAWFPGMGDPGDEAQANAPFAPFSVDTYGNTTGSMTSPAPAAPPQTQQPLKVIPSKKEEPADAQVLPLHRNNAAMWKSMWKS